MLEVRPVADQDEYSRAIGAIGQYFNPPPSEEMLARFVHNLPHDGNVRSRIDFDSRTCRHHVQCTRTPYSNQQILPKSNVRIS